ncbi:hypothetical protein LS66_000095 [Helicobacter sp. MIT 03-1614]|jgi:hypothetical protein|uniref:Uncharacterized protein n=2 Tax=Helicobacter TaxID=209 RepID=Q7VGK3_HELHP|nr:MULTISPECIES: hypothetical protein [Helicobacter]AAP77915.1 hypothetical protein HH_1318 [Helicobacter hepaticus ATCC 51449]TLD90773.1 hypothetical protein LS66_000095 [Helicobacter sp. MIT 03-1614]
MAHIDKKIECLGTSFLCNELYEVKLKHDKRQEVVFRAIQISRDRLGNKLAYLKPRAYFANGQSVCLQMFLSFCDLNTLQVCDEKEKERLARLKELSDIDIK